MSRSIDHLRHEPGPIFHKRHRTVRKQTPATLYRSLNMLLLHPITILLVAHTWAAAQKVQCGQPMRVSSGTAPVWYRLACRFALQALRDSSSTDGWMTFRQSDQPTRSGLNMKLPEVYHPKNDDLHDFCAISMDFPGRFKWAQGEFRDIVAAVESIINSCMHSGQFVPASGVATVFERIRITIFLNPHAVLPSRTKTVAGTSSTADTSQGAIAI